MSTSGSNRCYLHLLLSDGAVPYDTLILATGATHHYFGHDDWAAVAPGLKTVEDATEIRRRVFLAFEAAEREPDHDRRHAWLTFAIVGAGPTGVELAGALAEIANETLRHDFRHIDPREASILLIEAADRVLPRYQPDLSLGRHPKPANDRHLKTGQRGARRRDVDVGGGPRARRQDGQRLECRETTAGDRAGATGMVAPAH